MAEGEVKRAVIIGGSAGSLEVIFGMLPWLPADADAVYIVVVHRKPEADSALLSLLASRTTMPVREVEDKEPVVTNTIFLAPADYHLLLEDEQSFSLDCSEKVHYSRPSIDVTFESAAQVFGERAIGILLSGANADGALGLKRIKDAGGITVAQNPQTADVGYMPQQAVDLGAVERVEEGERMGEAVREIVNS